MFVLDNIPLPSLPPYTILSIKHREKPLCNKSFQNFNYNNSHVQSRCSNNRLIKLIIFINCCIVVKKEKKHLYQMYNKSIMSLIFAVTIDLPHLCYDKITVKCINKMKKKPN